MRVISLQAENVKRLKAVSIEPDGDVVILSGANAQGKSSVLDAIWLALGGGAASKDTPQPVRDGQDQARVTLNLGDLTVTRTWTADGKTNLKVENADGARYGSPQTLLDALVGRLAFDPLAFAQQDEKTQRATLLSLVDLPFDPDALDSLRRGAFDQRTDVNRELKTLTAQLAASPAPESDVPEEELSLGDLLDQAAKARAWQDRTARLRSEQVIAQDAVDRYEAGLITARANLAKLTSEVEQIPADLPDPASYDAEIRDLEQTNQKVRAAQQRRALVERVETVKRTSEDLTERIAQIDQQKVDGLAAASMPIAGLGLDETGVTYQGVPLKQASSAEQLRVSVAIAMSMNPKLRVLRITDGSLLDSHNLALIAEMCAEHDYQAWIEVVDETGSVGIVIEDGQVAHAAPTLAVVK